MDKLKKLQNFSQDKDLANFDEIQSIGETLIEIKEALNKPFPSEISIKGVQEIKGDKGEKGEKGDTGEQGERGEKGDSIVGAQGAQGKAGKDGVGIDGKDGENGQDGQNGGDGKDGSPDTAEQVRDKLQTLTKEQRLDASAIKGIDGFATQSNLDRAIGILDQRTQFLINKNTAGGTTSPLTTKGDVYTYDTTNNRLPVGLNGQVLSADSTTSTGLKWTAVASSIDRSALIYMGL